MKTQRAIIWITISMSSISLILFVLFKTVFNCWDCKDIFSNIAISIFGSSLLVALPALFSFYSTKYEAKKKIINGFLQVENKVNDIQFYTTFLRDQDKMNYNLDFSFEKNKYMLVNNMPQYMLEKEKYEIASDRIICLHKIFREIETQDYSFYNIHLNDFVGLFQNEKYIHSLGSIHSKIVNLFMLERNNSNYQYGVRQYEGHNMNIGQFFEIYMKEHLLKLEPIYEKLQYLRTIYLICNLYFYKNQYKAMVNSKNIEKKKQLYDLINTFYENNDIQKNRWIEKLLKQLI